MTDETVRPTRFVVRIADRTLPVRGTWTCEIGGAGQDARLTITKRGEAYNPIIRVLARLVIRDTATRERYVRWPGNNLGQPAVHASGSSA